MGTLIAILLDGAIYTSWLFLVSAGLAFTYGVVRILNVAHGSFYALGGYMAAYLVLHYLATGAPQALSYLVLLGAALIIGLLAGPLIERGFLTRVYGKEEAIQLILTFSIFLIFEDVVKLAWGVQPLFADAPYSFLGLVRIGSVNYAWYSFLLVGLALIVAVALWTLVKGTRFGKVLAAVIEDREISLALGANVPRIYTVAFTMGAIFAALGGAFTAPMVSLVPGIGAEIVVLSFAVVAIGGLGSIEGAALGSLLVGLARATAVQLFPELDLFVIYLIMVAVLLLRPQGLFGRVEVRRI
ncbi:High-affinity branched-chain amino acid transport system permease protein LivH [bacterium HR25]|nr:High-affinity branched-chain amino acid transport system permease protein LivH [bacterium HR25]